MRVKQVSKKHAILVMEKKDIIDLQKIVKLCKERMTDYEAIDDNQRVKKWTKTLGEIFKSE